MLVTSKANSTSRFVGLTMVVAVFAFLIWGYAAVPLGPPPPTTAPPPPTTTTPSVSEPDVAGTTQVRRERSCEVIKVETVFSGGRLFDSSTKLAELGYSPENLDFDKIGTSGAVIFVRFVDGGAAATALPVIQRNGWQDAFATTLSSSEDCDP